MTVLCENCQTANRDRAMFCIGCAGKLPAFAATGPSALQSLGGATARPRGRPVAGTARVAEAILAGRAPRGLLVAVLLLGATVLALAAWIGFGPPRATPAVRAPATATAPLAPLAPLVPPPQALPVDGALAAGESTVPPIIEPTPTIATSPAPATGAPATEAPAAIEPGAVESPAPVRRVEPQRAPQRVASLSGASQARGAADPRAGCEQLFFVLAARCEARHCDEARYARHPRCTIVRAQRQRDEARRNLTQ